MRSRSRLLSLTVVAHVFGILAAVYARFVFTELILSLFTLEQLVYAGLFHTIICAVDVKPTSNICIAELVQSLRTNSAYHHRWLIAFATAAAVLAFSCHPHRQRFQPVIHLTLYCTFAYLPWIHMHRPNHPVLRITVTES